MTEEKKVDEGTGFSKDYVKELRNENAGWRTKVRDLEERLVMTDVTNELLKRGVDVNPKWVDIEEDASIEQSVDSFLENYPQFLADGETQRVELDESHEEVKKPVRVMPIKKPKTNVPGLKPKSESFGGRTLAEIKEDPKARASLRGQYRQLLAQGSNQEFQGD